ncbi:MAG: PDZ domain-containing protein [Actinomycetota bacterium]|nr:PDZ domain-containing protein [Actinomycetota bacterium]
MTERHPTPRLRRFDRRTTAGVLAAVLIVGLSVAASSYPVKYVVFYPGPTVNVLGKSAGQQIVDVAGHRAYRDAGELRLVTIIPTGPNEKVSLVDAMSAWISRNDGVYPYGAIYARTDTSKTVHQQSSQQMVSSQDDAVAAALRALHIRFASAVAVADVARGGPAYGRLKTGDKILRVEGHPVATPQSLIRAISTRPPGTTLAIGFERGNKHLQTQVTTVKATTGGGRRSMIHVSIAPTFNFPFQVHLRLDHNIGGPSAGLMFALGVYDVLTPGSLTHGLVIAGTGEITADGKVGVIGGIQQKLVGAQSAGARLFFVPAGNCAEALGGNYDPKKMRLVKVDTLRSAIADLNAWTKNPAANLPRCTR